ncbi:carbon monoxide dehydrogenase [Pigmentiphaga sp. NML080357]|uniref:FAD binding domain-containing protein n=1 Tax=Pigmentiphaga sp. NML080357 TaxID=2008675 RepID=UPI000B40A155|nr:FAD binding domain-containing protein [Pigmentiphaga sp. NML080357]OVZ62852.1 carbon monoxide dehydrogenase [Pigmentiphaga sp. NML080357]
MKPAAFDYVRLEDEAQACDLLARHGEEARVLAGGQSLITVLNMRLAQPSVLLDVSRCEPLDYAKVVGGKLEVGAAATQASVEWRPGLADEVPLLACAFPYISHFQVRNRGTVCGSVAHADPSAELPLCLALLDGEVVLASRRGRRTLSARDFFQGMLTTARAGDELIACVRYPLRAPGTGYAFEEFSLRHGDFAIAACAAAVSQDAIRLGVGGVADRPAVVQWPRLPRHELEAAINDFAWTLGAQDDAHASAAYRRRLVRQLAARAIATAAARAQGASNEG